MKDANGYKIIKVTEIPDCDLCKAEKKGNYDGPVAGIGTTWGNICQECLDIMSIADQRAVKAVGGKRELIVKSETTSNEVVVGKELTDFEELIAGDGNREIECPKCGEIRQMEPDARGSFKCEGCGRTVKIAAIM